MTKLSTRKSEVEKLEGFKIQIFDADGDDMDLDTQGLPAYKFKKMAAGTRTVVEYRARFQQAYPGLTCDVLLEDGTVAHGNTKLSKVRGK